MKGLVSVRFCHVKAGAPTGMIRYRSERRLTFTAIQHDMLLYKEIRSQLFTEAPILAATATDVLLVIRSILGHQHTASRLVLFQPSH